MQTRTPQIPPQTRTPQIHSDLRMLPWFMEDADPKPPAGLAPQVAGHGNNVTNKPREAPFSWQQHSDASLSHHRLSTIVPVASTSMPSLDGIDAKGGGYAPGGSVVSNSRVRLAEPQPPDRLQVTWQQPSTVSFSAGSADLSSSHPGSLATAKTVPRTEYTTQQIQRTRTEYQTVQRSVPRIMMTTQQIQKERIEYQTVQRSVPRTTMMTQTQTIMEWVQVPKQVTIEVPVTTEEIVSEQVAYHVPYTETTQVPVQTEEIVSEQVAIEVPYTETIQVPVHTQDTVNNQVVISEASYANTVDLDVPVTTKEMPSRSSSTPTATHTPLNMSSLPPQALTVVARTGNDGHRSAQPMMPSRPQSLASIRPANAGPMDDYACPSGWIDLDGRSSSVVSRMRKTLEQKAITVVHAAPSPRQPCAQSLDVRQASILQVPSPWCPQHSLSASNEQQAEHSSMREPSSSSAAAGPSLPVRAVCQLSQAPLMSLCRSQEMPLMSRTHVSCPTSRSIQAPRAPGTAPPKSPALFLNANNPSGMRQGAIVLSKHRRPRTGAAITPRKRRRTTGGALTYDNTCTEELAACARDARDDIIAAATTVKFAATHNSPAVSTPTSTIVVSAYKHSEAFGNFCRMFEEQVCNRIPRPMSAHAVLSVTVFSDVHPSKCTVCPLSTTQSCGSQHACLLCEMSIFVLRRFGSAMMVPAPHL